MLEAGIVNIPAKNADGGTDAGQVRVFAWSSGNWVQMDASILGGAQDSFGTSVSLSPDGTRLAVGAVMNADGGGNAGQVRIFEWSAPSWTPLASINGEADDQSGASVSLNVDGAFAAVGAPYSAEGRVRVYTIGDGATTAAPSPPSPPSIARRYCPVPRLWGTGAPARERSTRGGTAPSVTIRCLLPLCLARFRRAAAALPRTVLSEQRRQS